MNPNEPAKKKTTKGNDASGALDSDTLINREHRTALNGDPLSHPFHLNARNGDPSSHAPHLYALIGGASPIKVDDVDVPAEPDKPKKKLPTPFDMPDPRNGPTPRR